MHPAILDILSQVAISNTTRNFLYGFPYTDIVKVNEDEVAIKIAMAGIKKENIKVKLIPRGNCQLLEISGDFEKEDESGYVIRNIARRSVRRTFQLLKTEEVVKTTYIDGILSVHVKQAIPEPPTEIPVE